jgi:hypothetical protein
MVDMTLASTGLMGQNAPSTNDTIWATGHFSVENATSGAPIQNANIAYTANQIPGDTIPDNFTYNFFTNDGGWVIDAYLPLMIDIGVGTEELQDIVQKGAVFPQPSSRPVVAFRGKATDNYITIVNSAGQVVDKVETNYDPGRNISGARIDLQDKATGIYLFFSKTEEGMVTGKILNNKVPSVMSIVN